MSNPCSFSHYIKLHHSQTTTATEFLFFVFSHYIKLHHSQTKASIIYSCISFSHYIKLHHSQTLIILYLIRNEFSHYIKLHHSQTLLANTTISLSFSHYIKLHHSQTVAFMQVCNYMFSHYIKLHPCVKYWIHIFSNFQSTFLLYFNFKIGFFKSLFIRSACTTWSTTSEIVVILCPASLEDAPQWYILCLSVFQSMIIYLSWNSPPDF